MYRKLQVIIFFILVFITFCSPQSLWRHWAFLSSVSFLLLVCDLLFLNEGDFVYDPDYVHWQEVNQPKDFQFETDFVTKKDDKRKVF